MAEQTHPNFITTAFNNIYFAIAFILLAIIYFFVGSFFGLDFTDTFFHLNQAQIPPDGTMVYPILLSSLLIKGMIELTGEQLIYLRLINALLFITALTLPFLFIKTRLPKKETIFYIGLVIFLIAPLNANVLGYDSFSILINSIIFTLSVFYLKNKNLYVVVILSSLCSLSILIRLPNLLVLPILMTLIFFQQKLSSSKFHVKLLKLPILFLIFSLSGVFFGYLLYYKEWEVFHNATMGTISHDLYFLFYKYFLDGVKLIFFTAFVTGSYFLFRKIRVYYTKFLSNLIIITVYAVFIGFFLLRYSYPIFLTAIVFSILILQHEKKGREKKGMDTLILWMYFSFLFINALGSNLGLLKTAYLFLLLPFVFNVLSFQPKPYWKLVMIILIPLSIFLKLNRTYEGQNIFSLDQTLKTDILNPIQTNEERFDFLHKVDQMVTQLQKENYKVYFYGSKSHIFHYLYPNTDLGIKAIDQPVESLTFYEKIIAETRSQKRIAIFLIPSYPESTYKGENPIETKLIEEGFQKHSKGSLIFFTIL